MTTTVIINDFEKDRRIVSIFADEEFTQVEAHWEVEDKLLAELQDHPAFVGRTRWCDLAPTHFRLMLMRNLQLASNLTDDERAEASNPVIGSLNFLIGAMIYCLQLRAESHIELFRINRLSETEVAYDYAACLNMAVELPRKSGGGPKTSGLRVIVDNTDSTD